MTSWEDMATRRTCDEVRARMETEWVEKVRFERWILEDSFSSGSVRET